MTSTKIQPPRKLTEEETLDTFEDFWFQCECYYSRDPKFAPFFDDKNLTWRDRTVENRGLQNAETAANLNSLLRALATYTSGPYVRNELLDVTKSLIDVRKVFLKFLEIDITDHSLPNYYSLTRKPNLLPAQSFNPSMHSNPALTPQESEEMDGSVMFSRGGFNRGGFNRGGFNRGNPSRQNRRYQPPQRPRFYNNRQSQGLSRCEFCYMQSKGQGKSLDYNHNITNCPQMIAKFSKINLALGDQESDTEDDAEESQEFQEFYSEQL